MSSIFFTLLLKPPTSNSKGNLFKDFYTEKDNFIPMKFLFSQVRHVPCGGDISPFMAWWYECPLHSLTLPDAFTAPWKNAGAVFMELTGNQWKKQRKHMGDYQLYRESS